MDEIPAEVISRQNLFEKIWMHYVKRENSEKILEMLHRTDFFIAPASVKYHCNHDGGLNEHTLNAFFAFVDQLFGEAFQSPNYSIAKLSSLKSLILQGEELSKEQEELLDKISKEFFGVKFESIVISCFCHDFHKIQYYEKYKTRKKDEKGNWGDVEAWGHHHDPYIMGDSGGTSCYIAMQYMHLTYQEALAITNHMGYSDSGGALKSSSGAWKKSKLALYLHLCDMIATFHLED